MLERLESKTGAPICRVGGRLLASMSDPHREAEKWLQRRKTRIEDVSHVVVLGLGCGYHVKQLIDKYPSKRIWVIEPNSELKAFNEELRLYHAEILSGHTLLSLKNRLGEVFQRRYVVLDYGPSLQINPEYFQDVKNLLLGRSVETLEWQIAQKPDLKDIFDREFKTEQMREDLVSIVDLNTWVTEAEKKEVYLLRALGELVQ